MNLVLEDYARESDANKRLTTVGRVMRRVQWVRRVEMRARIAHELRAHGDEIRRVGFGQRAPIIICGLPRAGTTLLHGLLSCDPAARHLQYWELTRPAPAVETATYATDSRIATLDLELKTLFAVFPGVMSKHPFESVHQPEECMIPLELEGVLIRDVVTDNVPSYLEWLDGADLDATYAYYKEVLQLLCWKHAAKSHLVLKAPQHSAHIESIWKALPDANFVGCHRDVSKVIASLGSLMTSFAGSSFPEVDRAGIGQRVLRYLGNAAAQQTAFSESEKAAGGKRARRAEKQVYNMAYKSLMNEKTGGPIGEVKRIYKHFGYPMTAEFEEAMQAYMDSHSQRRHGHHKYGLEELALDDEQVEEAFAPYIEAFGEFL